MITFLTISLYFALSCDDFRAHMCAENNKLETSQFGHRSARERFIHACGVHWGFLVDRVSLPAVAGFYLPFAWSDDEYAFCRWLALALEEDAPRFGGTFFYLWRVICKVSRLIMDEVCGRPSLPVDLWYVLKVFQYLWQWSASLEPLARDQLGYLVSYECVEIFSFTAFARLFC